jgi:hypothetical protein
LRACLPILGRVAPPPESRHGTRRLGPAGSPAVNGPRTVK